MSVGPFTRMERWLRGVRPSSNARPVEADNPLRQTVLIERDQWVRDSPEPYVPFADRPKNPDQGKQDE